MGFGRARALESGAKTGPLAAGALLLFVRFTRAGGRRRPGAGRGGSGPRCGPGRRRFIFARWPRRCELGVSFAASRLATDDMGFGRARALESGAKTGPLAAGALLLFVRFTRYARARALSAARRIRAALWAGPPAIYFCSMAAAL